MDKTNLLRELDKIHDVLEAADRHFRAEAEMNAALHLSAAVRPAPLAAAVQTALGSIKQLATDIEAE